MPTALRVDGFRFFFFSNEGTEPRHIHIESSECHAKFWLEPIELAKSIGYNSGELRKIRQMVEANHEALIGKWNEHFKR